MPPVCTRVRRVLVVGASGGVGTYAVQLAVAAGATVTGVASTTKLQFVKDLGAAEVIDYTVEDFADGSRTFDVVLDIGGVTPIKRLRRALSATGTLAIVGGENGATWSPGMGRQLHATLLNPFVSQRLTMVMNKEHYSGLERLAAHVDDGSVASFTDRPFCPGRCPGRRPALRGRQGRRQGRHHRLIAAPDQVRIGHRCAVPDAIFHLSALVATLAITGVLSSSFRARKRDGRGMRWAPICC